ncbi:MAG TPA: complex I NDUFA9 subunit family protein [Gammaproteobacteria bacterium]|nr:complex I NDUFA9 subunit family protein [Gammaproteobacteria bacterium]
MNSIMGATNTQSICIVGGAGFVGRHLSARLLAQGHRVTIFTRRLSDELAARLSPADVVEVDTESARDCVNALSGHSALINLAGILHESRAQRFQSVHAELPARLVQACTSAGVQRYLHMSALRADMKDPPSAYLRSKARGEAALNAAPESLAVDVFRPSIIFGAGDNFFGQFAGMLRWLPVFPLVCQSAKFAPVWVDDVTQAFASVLAGDAAPAMRRSHDLCGPRTYTFRELIEFTATALGKRRLIVGVPDWAARLQGLVLQHFPEPLFTLDNYYSLQVPSTCECNALLSLGIEPSTLETVMTPLLSS